MPRRLPFPWIARALALLLLVAAALKVNGLGVDPVGKIGRFTAPAFQVGVIELEIFLALWLLSGKQVLGAWLTAITAFVSFASVSAYQGWIGQATCGCFGRLSVNPWYTFALDVGIVFALGLGRPGLRPIWTEPRVTLGALVPRARALAALTAAVAGLVGAATLVYGSPDAALARLRGERIFTRPALVDVGSGAAGDTRMAVVEVVNSTGEPIGIIGGTHDWTCTITGSLPVVIPAGEARTLTVRVKLPQSSGAFTRSLGIIVANDNGLRHINFRVTGRITEPPE